MGFPKDDSVFGVQDDASSGETQFKPQMAQSITGANSTGENGVMRWNNKSVDGTVKDANLH